MLGVSGKPFWQQESYDRAVRNQEEFERIRRYVELNPVRAGLVSTVGEYRYSSANRIAGLDDPPGLKPISKSATRR